MSVAAEDRQQVDLHHHRHQQQQHQQQVHYWLEGGVLGVLEAIRGSAYRQVDRIFFITVD